MRCAGLDLNIFIILTGFSLRSLQVLHRIFKHFLKFLVCYRLYKEVERLKRYEQAIDQILKPDNDEMMGRPAGEG